MNVFVVSEGDWDEYHEHGTFSTREKAEAYIAMVVEAEEQADVERGIRSELSIKEIAVDAAADQIPVFIATGILGSPSNPTLQVIYLSEVPESRFFRTLDLENGFKDVYAAEGFGRTVDEAYDQVELALARAQQEVQANA